MEPHFGDTSAEPGFFLPVSDVPTSTSTARHAARPDPDDDEFDFAAELEAYAQGGSSQVRPYFFTKGRTRAAVELALEALVSATPGAAAAGPAQIALELCREPRSVAEIAALLTLPLGVARVLLGDLVEAGSVIVHRTAEASGPDLALMQRVLAGLRNL